jgi:hypothetical protein
MLGYRFKLLSGQVGVHVCLLLGYISFSSQLHNFSKGIWSNNLIKYKHDYFTLSKSVSNTSLLSSSRAKRMLSRCTWPASRVAVAADNSPQSVACSLNWPEKYIPYTVHIKVLNYRKDNFLSSMWVLFLRHNYWMMWKGNINVGQPRLRRLATGLSLQRPEFASG